ncbi:MAG: Gfo/Idh/MocA family oxidoreductase [Clostridia bacterium]
MGRIDCLEVCGSYDIREERQEFARQHGITPYASFEELLAEPKVDIVLCATPNDVHTEVVTRSLRARQERSLRKSSSPSAVRTCKR